MKEIIIFYKGKAGNFKYYADLLENKYYGWKLMDVIKDLEKIKEKKE